MLQPRKTKHAKQFRGKMRGASGRGSVLSFGEYGLKALDRGWITAAQIEAARKVLVHYSRREGKIWVRIFPEKPITKKALGTRMGSGKGDINKYVAVVTPGRILFELTGVSYKIGVEAFAKAADKLPINTKFVAKTPM